MNDSFANFPGDDFAVFGSQQIIENELTKGEKLLWRGQPKTGRGLMAALPVVIFGIPWTLFSLFWMGITLGMSVIAGPVPSKIPLAIRIIFPIFGLPFVLIGLGMLSSPYWLRRRFSRTVYAVTDQRVIICEPGYWGSSYEITSVQPEELRLMTKVVRSDGSGDIHLTEMAIDVRRGGRVGRGRKSLIGIPQVNEVDRLIRNSLMAKV